MANLNRIKVVLVEKGRTGKWLAEEIGPPRPSENGTSRHITVGRAAIATPP